MITHNLASRQTAMRERIAASSAKTRAVQQDVTRYSREVDRAKELRKPNPKAMQQLVTAWKVLQEWRWK